MVKFKNVSIPIKWIVKLYFCALGYMHTVCVCYKSLGTCYTHAYKCAINFFRPVYGPFKSDVTTKKPF